LFLTDNFLFLSTFFSVRLDVLLSVSQSLCLSSFSISPDFRAGTVGGGRLLLSTETGSEFPDFPKPKMLNDKLGPTRNINSNAEDR
jgi:hypothetical protein